MLTLTVSYSGSIGRITEAFTVASVTNPLLVVGKLIREGWEIKKDSDNNTFFTDAQEETKIPVHFNKNSLAAYAYVQTPRTNGFQDFGSL